MVFKCTNCDSTSFVVEGTHECDEVSRVSYYCHFELDADGEVMDSEDGDESESEYLESDDDSECWDRDEVVCSVCGNPAKWVEDEEVANWKHELDIIKDDNITIDGEEYI